MAPIESKAAPGRLSESVVPTSTPSLALSMKETAAALGVSPRTIWSLIASGELRSARVGRRVLVPRAELARFLASKMEGHK